MPQEALRVPKYLQKIDSSGLQRESEDWNVDSEIRILLTGSNAAVCGPLKTEGKKYSVGNELRRRIHLQRK